MKWILPLIVFSINVAFSQNTTQELIGEWAGRITSTTNGGSDNPTVLKLNADGSFTESSDYLRSLYPNTQQWTYIDSTNQIEFSWVKSYYAGMPFYMEVRYRVITLNNDSLVLFYDRADLVDPLPHVSTMRLGSQNRSRVIDLELGPKEVIKVLDLYGREVDRNCENLIVIELLNDGSTRKVWRGIR